MYQGLYDKNKIHIIENKNNSINLFKLLFF